MSDIPSFPYSILWEERSICSVANLTRRDGEEFMALAPKVPVRTEVETFPLEEANEALNRLARRKDSRRSGAGQRLAASVMKHSLYTAVNRVARMAITRPSAGVCSGSITSRANISDLLPPPSNGPQGRMMNLVAPAAIYASTLRALSSAVPKAVNSPIGISARGRIERSGNCHGFLGARRENKTESARRNDLQALAGRLRRRRRESI